jgi:hypothetical protein
MSIFFKETCFSKKISFRLAAGKRHCLNRKNLGNLANLANLFISAKPKSRFRQQRCLPLRA